MTGSRSHRGTSPRTLASRAPSIRIDLTPPQTHQQARFQHHEAKSPQAADQAFGLVQPSSAHSDCSASLERRSSSSTTRRADIRPARRGGRGVPAPMGTTCARTCPNERRGRVHEFIPAPGQLHRAGAVSPTHRDLECPDESLDPPRSASSHLQCRRQLGLVRCLHAAWTPRPASAPASARHNHDDPCGQHRNRGARCCQQWV